MKEFQDISKAMPYAESKDYINKLISDSTETAINKAKSPRKSSTHMWIAAAIATLLLAGVGITYFHQPSASDQFTAEDTNGPIDNFLNNLTDEEAQMIAYYEIEEIPEY